MLRWLLPLAILTPTAAQTPPVVDPPLFEYMAGGRDTGFPFGYARRQVVRHQQIHDGLAGTGRVVSEVRIRRTASQITVPAFRATCSLMLSTATRSAANLSNAFAQNTGTDRALVLDRKPLAFPPNTPPTSGLPAFDYAIPASTPYSFTARGPLCIDLRVHSHTNKTPVTFDLYQEGRPHVASFGVACGGLDHQTSLTGDRVTHAASGLPADGPLFFLAGAPLRQPIDLTPLGAPMCFQSIQLTVLLPGFASSTGDYKLEFDASAARPGQSYASQVMAVQPGLNAFGAVTSQANLVLPIGARQAGRLWAEDLNATTGTAQSVFALVVEVR